MRVAVSKSTITTKATITTKNKKVNSNSAQRLLRDQPVHQPQFMVPRLTPTRVPVCTVRRSLEHRGVVRPLVIERERRHVLAFRQPFDEQHDRQTPVVAVAVKQAAPAARAAAVDGAGDEAGVGPEHGEYAQARAGEAKLRVLTPEEQPPGGTLRGAERGHGRAVALQGCRAAGLQDCRAAGLQGCRAVGMRVGGRAGLRGAERVEIKLCVPCEKLGLPGGGGGGVLQGRSGAGLPGLARAGYLPPALSWGAI